MRQFITIAINAFMELIRQPVFLLLMTSSAVFEIFLATPFYFAFGDEPKLVKNSTLAVMLLAGLLGAVLSASASLAREIRTGTALAVLSKPVGRAQFLLAKYAGLILALALLTYVNLVAALLASRMAFDAYGSTDLFAVGIFALSLAIAYMMGGFSNFFLRRPFVSDCVFCLMLMVTIAFVVINFYTKEAKPQAFATGVDWRLIPAAVLILFALWILAGLALACSTHGTKHTEKWPDQFIGAARGRRRWFRGCALGELARGPRQRGFHRAGRHGGRRKLVSNAAGGPRAFGKAGAG